jgi:hypothetical protein
VSTLDSFAGGERFVQRGIMALPAAPFSAVAGFNPKSNGTMDCTLRISYLPATGFWNGAEKLAFTSVFTNRVLTGTRNYEIR